MGRVWTGNTRAPWHDYTQRQIYHITLKKLPEVEPFGCLGGDWRLPSDTYGRSYIKASPLGNIIKSCIKDISSLHPALRIYQYTLMPDHLHLLLYVEAPIDEILGRKIAAFKVMINKRANRKAIFDKGFNDRIVTTSRKLDVIYNYLRDNPYRLAVRLANPDFFTRCNKLTIRDKTYSAYGNIHLLSNPFKEQVVFHRADSEATRKSVCERLLYTAANGGVLVSPFISPMEKGLRAEAETLGAKIILITNEAFPERFKPASHDFELCTEGRLLIITLGLAPKTPLTRTLCLAMNTFAQTVAYK